jgi:hypothetical protein
MGAVISAKPVSRATFHVRQTQVYTFTPLHRAPLALPVPILFDQNSLDMLKAADHFLRILDHKVTICSSCYCVVWLDSICTHLNTSHSALTSKGRAYMSEDHGCRLPLPLFNQETMPWQVVE